MDTETILNKPPKPRKRLNKALTTNGHANPSNKKIDVGKALELRLKGLSYEEIGKQFGCSKVAVFDRLKRFRNMLDDPDSIKVYEDNTSKLLSNAQVSLLSAALNPDTVKKSSTLQLLSGYGILFDKQRIINNLSTANISIRDNAVRLSDMRTDLEKQIAEMQAQHVVDSSISDNNSDSQPT